VKVGEMFPDNYLKGSAIVGTPMMVLIVRVQLEELRTGPDKPEEPAYVLYFENINPKTDKPQRIPTLKYYSGLGHAMVLRRELAEDITQATGASDSDQWPTKRIVVFAGEGRKVRGKISIPLHARAPKQPPATPPQTQPPTTEPQPEQAEGQPA
jgi:hypothetical protein